MIRDGSFTTMRMRERKIGAVLTLLLAGLVPVLAQAPPGMLPYTAIHQPQFVPASEAGFLQDDDILLGVASGNVAKAFPAADLAQHGAVFDTVPDGPISVTWCGVCNTGVVFRAEVKGRTLHFQYDRMVGANEVQKDLETGSSWQQATGEAIDGPLKGTRLTLYPVVRTTWAEWRKRYPNTMVLKPLPGSSRGRTERSPDYRPALTAAGNSRRTRSRSRDSGVPVFGAAHCARRQRSRGRSADSHRSSALV